MKKIAFFTSLFLMAAVVSCHKEETPAGDKTDPDKDGVVDGGEEGDGKEDEGEGEGTGTPEDGEKTFVLTASVEEGEIGFNWTAGDKVAVLSDAGNIAEYTLAADYTGTGAGTFNGEFAEGEKAGTLAWYPYSTAHTAVTFTLPAAYGDASAAHAVTPNVALAAAFAADAEAVTFNYLTGMANVKVQAVPAGYDRFVFTVEGGNIAGEFSVSEEAGVKVIKAAEGQGSADEVTFNFAATTEGQNLEFNIPMPVGTYTGYTVVLKNSTAAAELTEVFAEQLAVERAKVTAVDASKILEPDIVEPPVTDPVVSQFTVTVTDEWTKTGTELGLVRPWAVKDIEVFGDNLLVMDTDRDLTQIHPATPDQGVGAYVKAYSKTDGAFVQNVKYYEGGWLSLYGWAGNLAADEDGNFCSGIYNVGAAGSRLDIYKNQDALNQIPVSINPSAPADMGRRLQVLGSLSSGRGLAVFSSGSFDGYAQTPGQYCVWELNNGAAASAISTIAVPGVTSWSTSIVQRESLTDETMYIAYTDETGYATHDQSVWADQHNAHFLMMAPGKDAVSVAPECFDYRILDMKVFNLCGGRFMVSLQQTYSASGEITVQIYDFTDPEVMAVMTPSAEGFDKFRPYRSEGLARENNSRLGNVAVEVDEAGGCAYIYSYIPAVKDASGNVADEAQFACRKMTVAKTN